MADENEVVIEAGGGESPASSPAVEQSKPAAAPKTEPKPKKSFLPKIEFHFELNKKNSILLGVASTLFVAAIIVTIFTLMNKSPDEKLSDYYLSFFKKKPVEEKEIAATKRVKYSKSDVERLIEKAKLLYDSGDKENALKLYGEIAMFNEAISSYNLGIAKMGENEYKSAIDYFKISLKNGDNEFPAAINAAVCAIKLSDSATREHFLSLAQSVLPKYVSSPLYSYYYMLLQYYRGNYFETLASINTRTSNYFDKEAFAIAPRIYLLLDDNAKTLEYLTKAKSKDFLAQGLLLARDGRYIDAELALVNVQRQGGDQLKASMALALIYLKTGACVTATNAISEATSIDEMNATKAYPIKVFIRDGAFDSDAVQKKLAESYLYETRNLNALMFYFAPYKIFNPDKTISSIKKGQAGIIIDDASNGADYLVSAAKSSRANAGMVRGIEYALNGRIALANKAFKELEKTFPSHAVLLYNLALTYAQLGDTRLANKYFTKAYNLDQRNPEAGLFAIVTAKSLGINYDKFVTPLEEEMSAIKASGINNDLAMLYNYTFETTSGLSEWLGVEKKSHFSLMLAVLLTSKADRRAQATTFAKQLSSQLPNDLVAGAVLAHVENNGKDVKVFAKKIQSMLLRGSYDKSAIFYGPDIAYKTYIHLARISGLVYKAEMTLDEKLRTENYDRIQLLKAWAMTKLYMKKFDESFNGFSEVIFKNDNLNPDLLSLAGAAAIGSGRTADAISFFELSKISEKVNPESLYTLGLLYQEAGNLRAASAQYKQINDMFTSEFFDFNVVVK
jgi:tetratricopeptide (TPR) repeat protein